MVQRKGSGFGSICLKGTLLLINYTVCTRQAATDSGLQNCFTLIE